MPVSPTAGGEAAQSNSRRASLVFAGLDGSIGTNLIRTPNSPTAYDLPPASCPSGSVALTSVLRRLCDPAGRSHVPENGIRANETSAQVIPCTHFTMCVFVSPVRRRPAVRTSLLCVSLVLSTWRGSTPRPFECFGQPQHISPINGAALCSRLLWIKFPAYNSVQCLLSAGAKPNTWTAGFQSECLMVSCCGGSCSWITADNAIL